MGKQVSEYLGLEAAQTNFIDFFSIGAVFIGLWFPPDPSWNAHLKGGGTKPKTLRKRYLIHSVEGLWFLDSEETIG